MNHETRLDAVFTALAHPVRRAMLAQLSAGEANVKELAQPFDISPAMVSKHLKMLERAELISRGKDAQWRPCRLEGDALELAADWIDAQKKVWEARLDRLQAHLHTMKQRDDTT